MEISLAEPIDVNETAEPFGEFINLREKAFGFG